MKALNTYALELLAQSPLMAVLPEYFLWFLARPTPSGEELAQLKALMEANFRPTVQGREGSKVAVIPVRGFLAQGRGNWFGSGYDGISDAAEEAAADPSIKRVVLAVNSPGGHVTGLADAAESIAALAKVKPVSAHIEGTSASAAYWLTSQANDIAAIGSAQIGSIGITVKHVDLSAQLATDGVKVTEITGGKYKAELSEFKPLSAEAEAHMQSRVNAAHSQFLAAVSSGRGAKATPTAQAERFGEGRVYDAPVALSHGLIDKIQTAKSFYQALMPAPAEDHGLPARRALGLRLDLERAMYDFNF
jgi:capsid assembly protease